MQGNSAQTMTHALGTSYKTIDRQLYGLRKKWNITTNWGLLVEAVRRGYLEELLKEQRLFISKHPRPPHFTVRELQVIQWMCYDMTLEEIAQASNVSTRAIQGLHLQIRRKIGAANEAETLALVLYFDLVKIPKLLSFEVDMYRVKMGGVG